MSKNYIRKLGVSVSILSAAYAFSYAEKTAGSFTQPYIYCKENNLSLVLPYKEGTRSTKKSTGHLKKFANFINVLESGTIPKTTSFKMIMFADIMQGSSTPLHDAADFSSEIRTLLNKSKQKTDTSCDQNVVVDLTKKETNQALLDEVYIVDEAYLSYLQDRLTTVFQYELSTQSILLNPVVELVYSLFPHDGKKTSSRKKRKKTHARTAKKAHQPSTTSLEKRQKKLQISYICSICDKITTERVHCPICELAFYCSEECRLSASKIHGKSCDGFTCNFCEKITGTILQCSQCKVALYCSQQCQKAHWDGGHKEACLASLLSVQKSD